MLVTTLTKRLAEDLADYFTEQGVLCKWLHSELDAFERVELLRDLRQGKFEALVGVNLLREGLDLPEVSLVAILDADKEGFLAERDVADADDRPGGAQREREGDPVRRQGDRLDAAGDRRDGRAAASCRKSTTPSTASRRRRSRRRFIAGIESEAAAHAEANAAVGRTDETQYITEEYLAELEAEMLAAADNLEFERAAAIRDRIERMRDSIGEAVDSVREPKGGKARRGKGRVPRPKRNA